MIQFEQQVDHREASLCGSKQPIGCMFCQPKRMGGEVHGDDQDRLSILCVLFLATPFGSDRLDQAGHRLHSLQLDAGRASNAVG